MSDRRLMLQTASAQSAVTAETGTFEVESDINITQNGATIDVGFSGHPDVLLVWLDDTDFQALASISNNRWYRFALLKRDDAILNTIPLERLSNTTSVQTAMKNANAEYILCLASNTGTCDEGHATGSTWYSATNAANQRINNDGTIFVARTSSSNQVMYAGTYHYIALTGVNFGLWT